MSKIGIERLLSDQMDLVTDSRVGLVTNPSGVDPSLRSTIDLLADSDHINLRRLFGPEHGIRGRAMAGEVVDDETDVETGLPVSSLYGETRQPTSEMLSNIDVLVYDMQDIGVRYYTLIYTLANALKSAAEHDVRVVVLDRPNPIAPLEVTGNRVPDQHASFVGNYRLPVLHRLTTGELARYFNGEFNIGADLDIVPLSEWSRDTWYDETNLPWVPPSPNMPTLDTVVLYPGTCLFEGTNLSEGRGTARPFRLVGAPWIDASKWTDTLNNLDIDGVDFRPAYFTPQYHKHEGSRVAGVQVHLRDREAVQPLRVGLSMLISAFQDYTQSAWRTEKDEYFIDRLAGGPTLRKRVESLDNEPVESIVNRIINEWDQEAEDFESDAARYTLYD